VFLIFGQSEIKVEQVTPKSKKLWLVIHLW